MTGLLCAVDLPAPVGERWFEDYVPGSVFEFGHPSLSETEIVAFARDYDPQSIHADPAWSATGPFAGLIASGVHTIAVCARLYVDHYISQVASLASPGLDEMRWPRPVRPGDRLRIRVTVAEAQGGGLVVSCVGDPVVDEAHEPRVGLDVVNFAEHP